MTNEQTTIRTTFLRIFIVLILFITEYIPSYTQDLKSSRISEVNGSILHGKWVFSSSPRYLYEPYSFNLYTTWEFKDTTWHSFSGNECHHNNFYKIYEIDDSLYLSIGLDFEDYCFKYDITEEFDLINSLKKDYTFKRFNIKNDTLEIYSGPLPYKLIKNDCDIKEVSSSNIIGNKYWQRGGACMDPIKIDYETIYHIYSNKMAIRTKTENLYNYKDSTNNYSKILKDTFEYKIVFNALIINQEIPTLHNILYLISEKGCSVHLENLTSDKQNK